MECQITPKGELNYAIQLGATKKVLRRAQSSINQFKDHSRWLVSISFSMKSRFRGAQRFRRKVRKINALQKLGIHFC